ncbi:MAG: hypothetical protein M1832_006425 [Thelocarpon impressellum]|nr:MAG: hypothetical protein M1832_006425 [Thelocarpon impressellum]
MNYGVWGDDAVRVVGPFAKQGSRVKMSKDRLRAQCLPPCADCSYVSVHVNGCLARNAFACRWKYLDRVVCWVTQLVVDRDYRQRGLATGLLDSLKQDGDEIYGIVTSHAAACLAAAKAYGRGSNNIDTAFIQDHGPAIMEASPIDYIVDAKPHGSFFDPKVNDGTISSVDTGFFVDHTEPLDALQEAREHMDWPLGDLVEGHEFLLVIEAPRRRRSKSPRA